MTVRMTVGSHWPLRRSDGSNWPVRALRRRVKLPVPMALVAAVVATMWEVATRVVSLAALLWQAVVTARGSSLDGCGTGCQRSWDESYHLG